MSECLNLEVCQLEIKNAFYRPVLHKKYYVA